MNEIVEKDPNVKKAIKDINSSVSNLEKYYIPNKKDIKKAVKNLL